MKIHQNVRFFTNVQDFYQERKANKQHAAIYWVKRYGVFVDCFGVECESITPILIYLN